MVPIVALSLDRGVFHHGALGIARSAGRLGIPVYRTGRERWAPGAFSRYTRGCSVISDPANAEAVLHSLHRLREKIGRSVLIAVDDVSSLFIADHAAALGDWFIFPRQPAGLERALSSKREMYRLCQVHGVPAPLSHFPESESELLTGAQGHTYPTVLKAINAGDAPAGSPRVSILGDESELIAAYRQMQPPGGRNVMLQEYVPGAPDTVWMFNGYFDSDSECRVGFTGRKLRQSPPYTGATTLGVCVENATVRETTLRFMKAIGYRGILDIGYRFDERDGQYKLLDVNPRIGGTFRLFLGSGGIDVLRAMYLDLTGREIPATSPIAGRRWLVEPLDLASSITYLRRRDITPRSWAQSFRGVQELAWFAPDDPLPGLAMCVWLVLAALPRLARADSRAP